mmetsp:Transcript_67578/g.144590  ORF Transcript_67578/g.144590 Transcript_67578/m.144590 type:complete len:458 (+) Transcript_67578:181-1554(+)
MVRPGLAFAGAAPSRKTRKQLGLQTSVLFPCPVPSYTIDSFPGELVWVPRASDPVSGDRAPSGDTVPCLLLPYESARFLLIFFHSNAEDLGRCRSFCYFLRDQFQVHVLAVEYPGYGACANMSPTRENVLAHAEAALRFAMETLRLPLEQIKVFGRSIGTGLALHLASKFPVAGLILVTPFVSIRQAVKDRAGPLSYLFDEWFQNDEAIKSVSSPTMIIHGKNDEMISWRHGQALYSACCAKKLFINPSQMEHNANLTLNPSLLIAPMFRFFSLPDYSFQELVVPTWAFDKRASPLYVRPQIEVCSGSSVPSKTNLVVPIAMPAGDDADMPELPGGQEEEEEEGEEDSTEEARHPCRRPQVASGDTAVEDEELNTAMAHPTVLHTYQATKQQYRFCPEEPQDAPKRRASALSSPRATPSPARARFSPCHDARTTGIDGSLNALCFAGGGMTAKKVLA